MEEKVSVIVIEDDGKPKTYEVTRKEAKGKCKEKYGSKLWVV